MERTTEKIFGMRGILIASAFLAAACAPTAMAQDDGVTVITKEFKKAEFNPETKRLEFVLSGRDAQTRGVLIAMKDLKVEMIGSDGKTIKGVITSPLAEFDRSTMDVRGDREIHYQSAILDVDGIGFDASDRTQKIHIRSKVKVFVRTEGSLFAKKAEAAGSDSARNE